VNCDRPRLKHALNLPARRLHAHERSQSKHQQAASHSHSNASLSRPIIQASMGYTHNPDAELAPSTLGEVYGVSRLVERGNLVA
jgi:hypothetical protein